MPRKIGSNQKAFLKAMRDHNGTYYPGCGWIWGTTSESIRIAESLVKRGLVSKTERPRYQGRGSITVYKITEAGLAEVPTLQQTLAARRAALQEA